MISVGLELSDQLLIGIFAFVRYCRKNGSIMEQYINYSSTLRKPKIQLGGKVLYNILTEFRVPIKLVRLIKMCLTET
jgi:hypothetical protein